MTISIFSSDKQTFQIVPSSVGANLVQIKHWHSFKARRPTWMGFTMKWHDPQGHEWNFIGVNSKKTQGGTVAQTLGKRINAMCGKSEGFSRERKQVDVIVLG